MNQKICFILTALFIIIIMPANVLAATVQNPMPYNYEFDSGPDTKETFGVPTQTDAAANNPDLENVRRNKDAAYMPPGYGIFSGEIPTDQSSLYHTNTKPDYASNITNYSAADVYNGTLSSASGYMSDTGVMASTSTMQSESAQSSITEISVSQSANSDYLLTQANLYEDGSIGTIKIPKLNLNVKVFEGETISNLKKGVGHFEFTSAWTGNVGIAGHNRGSSAYLSGIWNLEYGDEIIYTTKYGQRKYKVFSIEKISDTDYSKLGFSNENMLTLITCSANEPSIRWAVQAIEK